MDITLLRFMKRRVRIKGEVTGREFDVAGVNWDTGDVLLLGNATNHWFPNQDLELIPEEEDKENDWHTA